MNGCDRRGRLKKRCIVGFKDDVAKELTADMISNKEVCKKTCCTQN